MPGAYNEDARRTKVLRERAAYGGNSGSHTVRLLALTGTLRDALLVRLVRGLLAFDLDRALGEHGCKRADGGDDGREDGANDADRQRKFGDHAAVRVLDRNTPDVAFMQQRLHLVHELRARDLE